MTLKIRQAKLLGKRDEFIEENLRLVTSVCRHFIHVASTKGMDFDDIFSIGSIGLVKAYDKFDLDYRTPQGKPVQFSTYAVPMISGEIRRWIRDTNYIKISRAIKDILYKILHFGLEDSSPELLAEKFDVKLKDAEEALKLFHTGSIRSLQEEISNDTDKSITLADSLATAVNDDYSYMEMEEFLKSLPLHIRHVVRLRYMKDLRQGEIAKIIGKSQAQVSRLLIRAKKLAKKYYSLKGEDNMPTPEQTSKVMDLLRTTNKSYKEIAEETEVKYATVAYYGMKIRGKVRPKKPNLSSECSSRQWTAEEKARYTKDTSKKQHFEVYPPKPTEKPVEKVEITKHTNDIADHMKDEERSCSNCGTFVERFLCAPSCIGYSKWTPKNMMPEITKIGKAQSLGLSDKQVEESEGIKETPKNISVMLHLNSEKCSTGEFEDEMTKLFKLLHAYNKDFSFDLSIESR